MQESFENPTRWSLGALLWLPLSCLCLLSTVRGQEATKETAGAAAPAEETRSFMEIAREALRARNQYRDQYSKERTQWANDERLLRQRIALLERQLADTQTSIADVKKRLDEETDKQKANEDKDVALRRGLNLLGERLPKIEQRVRALFLRMPPGLSEQDDLAKQIEAIPATAPEDPQSAIDTRLLRVARFLADTSRFQNLVKVMATTHEFDGKLAEARALYIGLGAAYLLRKDGQKAAMGNWTKDGFVWERIDGYAKAVSAAFAVLDGKMEPNYLRLPLPRKAKKGGE